MSKNVRNIDMYEDIVCFNAPEKPLPFFVSMCGISYCDASYKIERPNSDISVIEYIVSGCGTVTENNQTFYPGTGDIYYLKKGSNHLYYSDAEYPWTKIWINFGGVLAEKITECFSLTEKNYFHAPDLKSMFFDMYNISRKNIDVKIISEQISVIFLQIIQKLSDKCNNNLNIAHPMAFALKELIDNMTDFTTTLDDLASKIYCSKSHAIREFRSAYNITPYKYILEKRFSVAETLLKNTKLSISEIAEKTGFCDVHYFSGMFSKRYGISPSKYRKN